MYDVSIVIRRSSYPLCATGAGSEALVFEIIQNGLAAWGIPLPTAVRNLSEFVALLAADGTYEDSADDAQIKVSRSA